MHADVAARRDLSVPRAFVYGDKSSMASGRQSPPDAVAAEAMEDTVLLRIQCVEKSSGY